VPSSVELDDLPVGIVFLEPGLEPGLAPGLELGLGLGPQGKVVGVNAAACSLFGQPREAVLGSPGPGLLQLGPERWQAVLGVVAQGGIAEDDVQLVMPEGGGTAGAVATVRTVQLRTSQVSHDGRPLLQVVVIDVTARKHAEDAERGRAHAEDQAAAAQRLDSLGLVAGGIAHDFNNLLVGVLAEASAAREDRQLGPTVREALRRIEAAAGRMSHLTKQLLAYAGRGRVVTMPLDPDALLAELRDQLVRIVPGPAVVEVIPGAGDVVVEADPHLLRQVVIDLVANAGDAGARRVQVASRILSRESTSWWQLEVSDDGAGIDPVTLARIFDPFFSTKPDRHGLGLSAVHGIVRRLGGDIEVDSQPGQGARFRVRLPIVSGVDPRPHVQVSPGGPTHRLTGLRVLVADDEPSVRATVRRLLERRGASVVVAADGLEADVQLRDERFELVILDVTMPGRTGYDVLAFARATRPGLPVILMSGYTARVRGEGGEDEPDAFIEKPFTASVLDAAIDDVLRRRADEPER
jgi:signal transduction histidine kinase/CheY-like chemotaxis protein